MSEVWKCDQLRNREVISQRWTTWAELTKVPPPWEARCNTCRQKIGIYEDRDVMSDAICAHVTNCTHWRAFWRRLRHGRFW